MPKNVLIISSSPRKGGNSDLLCDEFLKGALSMGNIGEKIFLRDKNIEYCTGCGLCTNNHGAGCLKRDDMREILDKMIKADVIVLATPVYFYTMCAQMKTLIDRCCAKYSDISYKEFYFIATAAEENKHAMEKTFDSFRGFTDCLKGARECGIIYGTGVWTKGEILNTPLMEKAYNMGKMV